MYSPVVDVPLGTTPTSRIKLSEAKRLMALLPLAPSTDSHIRCALVDPGEYLAMPCKTVGVFKDSDSGAKVCDTAWEVEGGCELSASPEELASQYGMGVEVVDVYESDTFMQFADALEPFERTCIDMVGKHKPWDLGGGGGGALLHKEITPNGCKELAAQSPHGAAVFVDLGSGVGQAPVLMGLLSGMECHGLELQPHLHDLAQQWCTECASSLLAFRQVMSSLASRLQCGDTQ